MNEDILESEGMENEYLVSEIENSNFGNSLDSLEDSNGGEVASILSPSVEDVVVEFPSDYLDKQTFTDGVNQILDVIQETEEEVFVDGIPTLFALGSENISYNSVCFQCDGVDVYLPSDYAEDVFVKDGALINLGANYTLGAVLNDSSVSNYVNSEITVPTYHSATWYQYFAQYGQPYRVVDRYISNYGSLSSSTRDSVDLEFTGGNDWAGWSISTILLFLVVILTLIKAVTSWLRS